MQDEAVKEEPLSGSGYSDRPARKVQRPASMGSLGSRPIVGSTPVSRKLSSRVRSSHQVSVEAVAKSCALMSGLFKFAFVDVYISVVYC